MPLADSSLQTLRSLLDRLIPEDDTPGALSAGVENYIVGQIAGDCLSDEPLVAQGLVGLNDEAAARYAGKTFAGLSAEDADALLKEVELGRVVAAWPVAYPPSVFMNRLVELAHEGFYADPGNGGNRDGVSWKLVGYAPRVSK